MATKRLFADLITSVGAAPLTEPLARFCTAVADLDKTAVAASIGACAGGPLIAIGILAGGLALRLKADRQQQEAESARYRQLRDDITAARNDAAKLADILAAFADKQDHVLARLPGYEKADLAKRVAEELAKDLQPLAPELDADLRTYLETNDWLLRDIRDAVDRIDSRTARIEEALTTGRVRLPAIPDGVRNNLAQAGVSPNRDFVGREDLITRIHESLTSGETTALTHALSADGGVGKTEVAVAYVFDAEYADAWDGVWWLDASTAAVEQSIDALLRTLGYHRQPGDEPHHMRAELCRRLADGRHLVILDDIDDPAVLREFTLPPNVSVLATTRLSKQRLPQVQTLEVELFDPADAHRLLVKGRPDLCGEHESPHPEHADSIAAIADELGFHALAVALAGAAMRCDEGLTPTALLERLRAAELGDDAHPLSSLGDDDTGRKYGRRVAEALLLHLPSLESPIARDVLLALSLCHPEAIPFSLIATCLNAADSDIRKAVIELRDRSIIDFEAGAGIDGVGLISMHRLTQSAMRHREGASQVAAALESILHGEIRVFATLDQPESWPTQFECLTHAVQAIRASSSDSKALANLINQVACFLDLQGRSREAELLHVDSLAMRQRLFEGDHADVATSLNNLAHVRQSLGRSREAEPLHENALAMHRRLFEGDHPDVAASLNNLASVRKSLGREQEAEPLFAESLAMSRRLFGRDHPYLALGLNNLASVRESLGRVREAEPLYEEALAMCRRLFDGDHPYVASSLNNLAKARQTLGGAREAESLYEESLAMRRRLFDGDHPQVARSLNNLATCLGKQRRWKEAVVLHEEAISMGRRCLPSGHPSLQRWEENLAHARSMIDSPDHT